MKKNLLGKLILIIGVMLIFLFGIFFGKDPQAAWQAMHEGGPLAGLKESIHLGLDLKGGTHLIMQVVVDDAIKAESERTLERLKDQLKAANVNYADVRQPTDRVDQVLITGVPPERSGDLRRVVTENFAQYDLASGADNGWTVTMKPSIANDLKHAAVTQAIETIRSRVDSLGVTEPVIQEHGLGDYQILVQLPGIDDSARVKQIMQSTAMLEIRQSLGGPYPTEQEALAAHGGVLPPDAVLLHGFSMGSRGNRSDEKQDAVYLISRTSAVAGADVRDATPIRDENGRPAVQFSLTGDAGRRFANFTGAHVQDQLAILLDNKVREVATIQEQIHDTGRIAGGFTETESKDLSMMLRSGALPARINYLEERTVGPSLGADSIRQGVRAAIIGMAAVMIFMLVYYHGSGINADLALILNLIILLGFMGFTGATLTLPGIAGVILTVGMGVDSNVLIFERIREEVRHGKTSPSAVEQGFARAWVTLLDTHVTTIVSAAILFLVAKSGPVAGFAVTLVFGLLANLFTAVFVSRVIFDYVLQTKQRGELISI